MHLGNTDYHYLSLHALVGYIPVCGYGAEEFSSSRGKKTIRIWPPRKVIDRVEERWSD